MSRTVKSEWDSNPLKATILNGWTRHRASLHLWLTLHNLARCHPYGIRTHALLRERETTWTACPTGEIVDTVGIEPKRCGCKPLDLPSASGPTWSGRRDSNPQQPAWKAGTLPIELLPQLWLLPGKFRHVLREWGGQSYLYHGCWLSDNHLSQTSVFYRPKLNKRLNVL